MTNNPTKEKLNNYNFLINQPLGEDLFKNQSQEKIAKVISENIINNTNFKIIGIDGAWGSGKSNLVHLIEKKLVNTHKFFIYDVWGHQEDDQRKAILTEITEFVSSENITNSNSKWKSKLDNLVGKRKISKIINQPYLGVGILFTLFSIIYVPTVNNLTKEFSSDFFKLNHPFFYENFWAKFFLVGLPLIILFAIYICNFIEELFFKSSKWKSFSLALGKTLQVYTNKQVEEKKEENIIELDPSVREFRNWMDEIDKDLKTKIIIVFDNFDRLPKKHILNIWSSIHIFFAEKKYENIKVILPFDREHIQNAFKELNSDGNDKTFGDDYVNKTFDIVFRVTLPIMSDWKGFFEKQWKKAFVNYDQDELKMVVQVYEFLNRRITPREIISFINEILTIKLLDKNFKERYIAIFVLKKDEILSDSLKAIVDLEYLKGLKSIYLNDENFAKQITAIVYHIEVDKALELIYTQQLKDSLNKNDIEQFNNICKSDFIDSIFYSVISDLEILENPIKALSKIERDENLSLQNITQAWDLFYFKSLNAGVKVEKFVIEDWQLLLIHNHVDDQYLINLLNGYKDILDDNNVFEYISLLERLIDDLGSDRVLPLIPGKEINPENFVKIVEIKGNNYSRFKLESKNNSIDNYMSKLKMEDLFKLKNTSILNKNFSLSKYKEFLKLNLNSYIDQNNIQLANDTLLKLKETIKKDTNGELKDVLDETKIYSLHVNNPSSTLPIVNDLIAMRIAKGKDFVSYGHQFQAILDSSDKERSTQIAKTILNYIVYGDLLLLSKFFENSPLFKQTIHDLFSNNSIRKRANILNLIENYSEIKLSIGINDDLLLKEINRWEVDMSKLKIDETNINFSADCFIYDGLKVSILFKEEFNKSFKNLENEFYEKIFSNENSIYFNFFENLQLESLSQVSLDVFENQFLIKIKEQHDNSQWWGIFETYESNNEKLSVVNTLKNIRDKILNSNIDLNLKTANKLLSYLLKYNLLESKSDVFRKIIKNGFLTDEIFIDILLKNNQYIKELYQKSSKEERDGFRNIINEKRDEIKSLEDLAKFIGINKPKKKSESEDL